MSRGRVPGRTTARARAQRDEQGFAGGAEALVFGFLIFVAGTLLVAHAWGVVDTKLAADAAAREAARSYVGATDPQTAWVEAQQAADGALSGYGRNPSEASVQLVGGQWGRCQRVTLAVRLPAPALTLPFVGRLGEAESVRADHSELVEPYRSGIPGAATCG
jgi:hypothetical protein